MFTQQTKDSLGEILPGVEISLEHPADLAHGDYSTNVALVLAKRENKTPKDLAGEIAKKWQEAGLPDFVEKIEVAGAGFLNIWLKSEVLSSQLTNLLKEGDSFGKSNSGREKTIVVDYSSPNIAKPFGIGHLRSTNIGQAIYNLYNFLGWKTIGDNHLGDWGTQFGRLICQIEIKNQKSKIKNRELSVEDLERLYVEFHKDLETNPSLEQKAREWFKKLEEGDKEAREIWQVCVDISLKEFDRIYKMLGIKIDYVYGESFYQDKMDEVLNDCQKKGILKESQGAKVIELPGMPVPAMLVKSDGATTYFLRDLATIVFRERQWQPDLIVYEVGSDQKMHFEQLFKIAVQLEYAKMSRFIHVSHGLMRWSTGKFSTRKGQTIHLEEVLTEVISRAEDLCKSAGVAKDLASQERKEVAKKIGIGAIKYNDLRQNPETDIIFDWDQILSLSGNCGPYLQYTYARTQSVINKSKIKTPSFAKATAGGQLNNEELSLLRIIYRFPEIVEEAARSFSPNILCNFLFDLAQKFNLFYDKNRIIHNSLFVIQEGDKTGQGKNVDELTRERSIFRLALTAGVGQILKNGLNLLGIEALERM